jgi:hypothetical protein
MMTKNANRIDDTMEQASRALSSTRYFEAERLAHEALLAAHLNSDYGRMARIVLPLQEARRQIMQTAVDAGRLSVLDDLTGEVEDIEPGCYLVQPMMVAADARRLRLAAREQEIPVLVLCREPMTMLGQPVVAIAPGVTVRTKVDPPANPEEPELSWFVSALEQIGDFAIDSIDPGMSLVKKVDALVDRLEAIPDHEKLHQALAAACETAQREAQASEAKG